MEAEHWRQIETLFEAVRAQPPEQRAAFLAQACPDDPQLRSEVQSLLDQQADSFLESAPVSPVRALGTGAKLGGFEIVELIGRGGMGEVYRARDSRLKREVAIKVLPAGVARDPERIARFEREARAAGALNHPNIVSVYEIGREGEIYWIATELVAGEPLASVIERGPIAARKAIEIAAQIADGLAAAHAAGIVHRDLKPANVMMTRDGRVKILDFGLAKQRRTAPGSTTADLTDEGVVLGTAGYMSPEQVRGEPADYRSDLFSFGVLLYEMLCGKRAFAGDSSVEVMNAILKDEPSDLPESMPGALNGIVRRCLQKEADRRFQSAADLGFALVSVSPTPKPATAATRRRWWPARATSVFALVIATASPTWWIARRFNPPVGMPDGTFQQLTSDSGLATDAAISPDGKLVAYASDRANHGNLDIWVQQVDGGRPLAITDDPADDDQPTFSPDGTQIAFHSEREGGGIYVVSALGGEARLLVPRAYRPRFSPDGHMLMYAGGNLRARQGIVFVQRLPNGPPIKVGWECKTGSSVWAPDSAHVIVAGGCSSFFESVTSELIWGLDGKSVPSPALNYLTSISQWLANPSRLLAIANLGSGSSVQEVPVSADSARITGPRRKLTLGIGHVSVASAATNGQVALSYEDSSQYIWGIPIDGQGHSTGDPKPLTAGFKTDIRFSLSKDGSKLAFSTWSAGRFGLYYRDLTRNIQRELPTAGERIAPALNSDGTKVLFFTMDGNNIYEMSASGGMPAKIWSNSNGLDSRFIGDWSPDGGTVFFNRSRGGAQVVHELELNDLSELEFLHDPEHETWDPRFSHDGRWVTFNAVKAGRSCVFIAPFRKALVDRSEWIPITDGPWDDKPNFSYNDDAVFFTSDRDGYWCFWAQPLGSDKRPAGVPFPVYHAHQRRRSLTNVYLPYFIVRVGPNMIVFNQAELRGDIWLFNPANAATK